MADNNYAFNIHGAEEQMCSGYLYKSPPENQFKSQKSWKRRFFVLLKYSDNKCQLKYYKNEEKNKPLGDIDLSNVTYMFLYPEMHAMWKWIHNNFRCSSSCVMFIRVPEREYFLIGENSWEMDKWFTALYDILNNRPHRLLDRKTFGSKRQISEPPRSENDNKQKTEWGQTKPVHELTSSVTHEPIYVSPMKFIKTEQTEINHENDDTDDLSENNIRMSTNKKKPAATSTFYNEPVMVEELYTGYLLKSPAQSALSKNTKSWKRRFFVLSKTTEDSYQLTYHVNNERKEIDLSKISLLFTGPETHQKWDWIQKNFKCSPSSVLFLKVEDDAPKHSREYFLIGENSADVEGWLSALVKVIKTQKSQYALQENRFRSASEPVQNPEEKAEDESDDRRSAPELMLTYPSPYSHYDYPRKLSEPPLPVELKQTPVTENENEEDEMQDNSAEDNEYMSMASLQSALEEDQQETDNTCMQKNHKSSVCSGAIDQDEDDDCNWKMHVHVEKEICVSQNDLKNSLILTQAEGKPCVSDCRMLQDSCLFHKGDQILAFNDLLIDTVEEIQTYVRRLSKDEVKLTIRRLIGSQPLHSEPCLS
ncbi:pleckstrin homology domain-containing family S member 1-like [Puntigrus tetrazona]|uniref:pleckstrin homology domain-containing family S member 1-like n=1 Tax=Puntigrus tetrazona TaxID=1606681 RepID=UPI001C892F22|nr:pleckstrin homology domain-containing family S member 1-like [Puntigrus tetrazona]